jgi:adenosine/AMP kinase
MLVELKTVSIEKGDEINFILGQSHFIKSVEDLYEAMVNSVPEA